MRKLLSTLCLISSVALGYPAGPPNTVVRVPPGGGPVKAGAVDLTKSAAVTGLGANSIPYFNGSGGLGLQNLPCTFSASKIDCDNATNIQFRSLTSGIHRGDSSGNIFTVNQWTIATRPTTFVACTSSPCAFQESPASYPGVSSIVRTGLGVYRVDFTGGFWSIAPSCMVTSGGQGSSGTPGVCNPNGLVTTTQFGFVCGRTTTGSAHDDSFYVHCVGPR